MSALTDAVKSLTAANAAEHEEVSLVLAAVTAFPAQMKTAIDDALAKGATPEELAQIQAVNDQQTADTEKMKAALAAPPPATPTA